MFIFYFLGVLAAQTIGGHQVALSQIKQGQPQLMLQQLALRQQSFQLQPLQVKPPSTAPPTSVGLNIKPKSKKRTTPTPPKH